MANELVVMDYMYSDIFKQTITSTYGDRGIQWLNQLPDTIEQCVEQWKLTDLKPYANLTYNYVLAGMMHNRPIVLKLRCDREELEKEIVALRAFEGFGCVKVIAHDTKLISAVLLERIVPGNSLVLLFPHDDEGATHIAADLMCTLHQAPIPAEVPFSTLEQTIPTFTKVPEELAPFIAHARLLRQQLLTTQSKRVLLHGDFHHDNILLSGDKHWLVIDPKGIIGDPYYDLAVYMHNPMKELFVVQNIQAILINRITTFASLLGYDRQRIFDWTYLQAVTSAYWSVEDGLDITNHLAFLTMLMEMRTQSHFR